MDNNCCSCCNPSLIESLLRYTGQTVTIFTECGGIAGTGFTGVLTYVGDCCVKLINNIGAPPACPLGSNCSGPIGNFDCPAEYYGGNFLGSISEIPINKIVSFTHNAI